MQQSSLNQNLLRLLMRTNNSEINEKHDSMHKKIISCLLSILFISHVIEQKGCTIIMTTLNIINVQYDQDVTRNCAEKWHIN